MLRQFPHTDEFSRRHNGQLHDPLFSTSSPLRSKSSSSRRCLLDVSYTLFTAFLIPTQRPAPTDVTTRRKTPAKCEHQLFLVARDIVNSQCMV
jgi:hypothetical protein